MTQSDDCVIRLTSDVVRAPQPPAIPRTPGYIFPPRPVLDVNNPGHWLCRRATGRTRTTTFQRARTTHQRIRPTPRRRKVRPLAAAHPHPSPHAQHARRRRESAESPLFAAAGPPGEEFKLLALIVVGLGVPRDLAIGTYLGVDAITTRPLEVAHGDIINPGDFLLGRRRRRRMLGSG